MSILDRFRITDHVAVVTGAGRGIGAATAVALAEAGADVVISSRTEGQLEGVAEQIRAAGRRALVVPANLAHTEAVAGLAQAAYDEFGRLDLVVNNVGGTIPNAFLDTDVAYLDEAFHFNVSTAHALTRAAVPLMLASLGDPDEHRQKSVVSISSMMGRSAGRGYLAYGTAKAALAHWSRLAATDLAPRIRVNGIYVGSVMTSALEFVAGVPETEAGRWRRRRRSAGSARPRTSPPRWSTSARAPASTSPARCSRSTAAWWPRTSTSTCPTWPPTAGRLSRVPG